LEAQKQNVASSKPIVGKQNVDPLQLGLREQNVIPSSPELGEQNVTSSKLGIDESSNLCGFELAMVIVYYLNDEIPPNIN